MSVLRRLTGEPELRAYAAAYASASGYQVPLEYLRRSVVFGFYRGGGLSGGVVMCARPPLRSLERIPLPYREAVAAQVDLGDTAELTCVWLDPALRRGARSALFWFGLFLETGRRGVGSVLFGTENDRLYRLYQCGQPRLLYHGSVLIDGRERTGWVVLSPVATRWAALTRMTAYKLARAVRRAVAPTPTGSLM